MSRALNLLNSVINNNQNKFKESVTFEKNVTFEGNVEINNYDSVTAVKRLFNTNPQLHALPEFLERNGMTSSWILGIDGKIVFEKNIHTETKGVPIDRASPEWEYLNNNAASKGVFMNEDGSFNHNIKSPKFNEIGGVIEDVASIQKSITATVIAILLGENKMNLNEKVSTYLGPWSGIPEVDDTVTLFQILTHTSGVDGIGGDGNAVQLEKIAEPGTLFKYSNTVYHRAEKCIEAVEGKSIEAVTQERLFQPLGMTDSHWIYRYWVAEEATDASQVWEIFGSPTGVISSARDLFKLGTLYCNDGVYNGKEIVKKSKLLQLFKETTGISDDRFQVNIQPNSFSPNSVNYGMLFWLNYPHNDITARGLLGRLIIFNRVTNSVFVRLGDQDSRFNENFNINDVDIDNELEPRPYMHNTISNILRYNGI